MNIAKNTLRTESWNKCMDFLPSDTFLRAGIARSKQMCIWKDPNVQNNGNQTLAPAARTRPGFRTLEEALTRGWPIIFRKESLGFCFSSARGLSSGSRWPYACGVERRHLSSVCWSWALGALPTCLSIRERGREPDCSPINSTGSAVKKAYLFLVWP